jgi:hypothetical protein
MPENGIKGTKIQAPAKARISREHNIKKALHRCNAPFV